MVGSLAALYCVDFGGVFHELHSIMHGEISTTFGSGRIHIWEQVLSAVPEHLLFGTGPDTMLYGGKPLPAMMNHSAAPSSGAST